MAIRRLHREKVGFVLSGGASLGAIQAGMLVALFERGIAPDLIVGTSAGALNAAFIAGHDPTMETAEQLAGIWRGLSRGQVFPTNPLTGLLGFLGRSSHLVPDRGLRRLLERHTAFERLEDFPVPLHVVATDIADGSEVRLSRGPAVDAVLASAAIPGVFAPVSWNGRTLVDGGVSNNTPISHALALGAEVVYVLATGFACALPEPPRGALAVLLHATSLLIQQRLVREIDELAATRRLIVVPPPCPLPVQPIDFSRADWLIEQSLADARAFLDGIGTADAVQLAMYAERLRPHSH
jgi:NTE family protein